MKNKLLPTTGIMIGLALLLGSLAWLNIQIVSSRPDAGELFVAPWTGARAFLDGENPYLERVAKRAQVSVYGRHAQTGEYPYYVDIPLYKLFFYIPFALIDDFEWALSLWMSVAEFALFGVGLLSIELSGWKPSAFNTVLFYLTLFCSFYGFYPVLGGSEVVFTALLLLLILFAIREEQDELLGVLLVFGTFNLAKGGLLFLLLLIWALIARRSRAISVMVMSLVTLLVISFLLLPSWILTYWNALSLNWEAGYGLLFNDLLQIWFPAFGDLIAQVLRWALVMVVVLEWFSARRGNFPHLLWFASLSICVVPFLNIYISPYFYSVLFLPFPLLSKISEERWGKVVRWVTGFSLILILSAWLLYGGTRYALQTLTFLYPVFLLLGLYWMRWWLLRSSRTWFDEIKMYQQGR